MLVKDQRRRSGRPFLALNCVAQSGRVAGYQDFGAFGADRMQAQDFQDDRCHSTQAPTRPPARGGRRSPEAERSAVRNGSLNASHDLFLGATVRPAGADGSADRAGASCRTADVGQRTARISATSQPFSPVLGRRAQSQVRRLLAGVVVAGVTDGRAVGSPAESRDDAVSELVPVQMAWHRTRSCPARPRSGPEAGMARAGDPAEEEPTVLAGRGPVDLCPVPSLNGLVGQPGHPLNSRYANRRWLTDEGKLLISVNGPGLVHRSEREQAGPEVVLRRHQPDCRPL